MKKLQIAILGCTGSIGKQTLDVVRMHQDTMNVVAISVQKSTQALPSICQEFNPRYVGIADEKAAKNSEPMESAKTTIEWLIGETCNETIAGLPEVDIVVMALTGMKAIFPLLVAMKKNKRVALANKECIVCGGTWMQEQLKKTGGVIHPVDSEQSAIYQCLQGIAKESEVERLILTASGGPFRDWSREEMTYVTREQALKHPNWSMGQKITIDSATLINKGLEVMEAAYLFDMPAERIDVFIHPQSIVHSMIETCDHGILAQLGCSDMRLPIQYALTYPHRAPSPTPALSWEQMSQLTFQKPDFDRFTGLQLAYDALKEGGTAPAIFNGANEVAVERFLEEEIAFLSIADCVAEALLRVPSKIPRELDDVLEADRCAREVARNYS